MPTYASGWTPIVELQTGQAVSDKLDSAFGSIDNGLSGLETMVDTVDSKLALHGVVSTGQNIITANIDPTKYTISNFDYYINNVKYSYIGSVQTSPFGQAGDFIDIGINASGLVFKVNNFFTPDELKTTLELGRIASSDGTNITSIGDSVFYQDDFMENLYIRFKSFEGAKFFGDSCKVSEHPTTPRALNVTGGVISTANMIKQVVSSEVAVSGFPVYNISGTLAIRAVQTPLIASNTQYDNGVNLVTIPTGHYAAHTLFRSSGTGKYYLQYALTTSAKLSDIIAEEAVNTYFNLQGSEVEPIAKIIVKEGEANIILIYDIREGKHKPLGVIPPSKEIVELSATSSALNQYPVAIDTPLQIEFGTAQTNLNVDISATGAMTFKTSGAYHVNMLAHFGREGANGVSKLFGRFLVNGVQAGYTLHATVDAADQILPFYYSNKQYFEAGDVLTFEIVRDSSGNDSGGLISKTTTLAWNSAPTASITITSYDD